MTAAISDLCQKDGSTPSGRTPLQPRGETQDWRSILPRIARENLDPPFRQILDELMAEALLNSGNLDELLDRLMRIPRVESSPRNIRLIETIAMSRLASFDAGQSIERPLDLWDQVIRRPWPRDHLFPAQFMHRLGALVDSCPPAARDIYHQRLLQAKSDLSLNSGDSPCVELVYEELKRVEAATWRASVRFSR
jgi:hypothetical protein